MLYTTDSADMKHYQPNHFIYDTYVYKEKNKKYIYSAQWQLKKNKLIKKTTHIFYRLNNIKTLNIKNASNWHAYAERVASLAFAGHRISNTNFQLATLQWHTDLKKDKLNIINVSFVRHNFILI